MPRSFLPMVLLLGVGLVTLPGAGPRELFGLKGDSKKSEKDKDRDDEEKKTPTDFDTLVETPLVGDYTNFAGLESVTLEGVGLVVGLTGTGGDPAPSPYRTALLEDMKLHQVPNPNMILRSPDTALVIVRAYLPPLVSKGETIDVEVRVPDSAGATSLKGGWLMACTLHEQAFVPGRGPLQGHAFARAEGPLLVGAIESKDGTVKAGTLLRGRIPGGATVFKERELAIYLRNDFRSIRNASRIAEAVGRRFHHFDKHGIKKPMAEAKNDQRIVLNVHPRYKNNFPRYLQVVRNVAFRETPVAQRVRGQQLAEKLLDPESADVTALQLEAIGTDSLAALREGLKSPLLEVQFHSAMALAYLGQSDGLKALQTAARDERAFRVYALAAMSVLDDAEAHLALRELMSESSAETRYGAFRSLWTLDRRDPFILGEPIFAGRKPGDEVDPTVKRRADYSLHVLETDGEAMVHATLRTRPEVVVFGAEQKFSTPLLLSAGKFVMISAQPGSDVVSVTRFEPDEADQRMQTSLSVAEVIRAASQLGATYPDIVQMLSEASHQRLLPTPLAIDTLPSGGRAYYRPSNGDDSGAKRKTRVGRENQTPNIFGTSEDSEDSAREKQKPDADQPEEGGLASREAEKATTSDDKPAVMASIPGDTEEAPKKPARARSSTTGDSVTGGPVVTSSGFPKSSNPLRRWGRKRDSVQDEPEASEAELPQQSEAAASESGSSSREGAGARDDATDAVPEASEPAPSAKRPKRASLGLGALPKQSEPDSE